MVPEACHKVGESSVEIGAHYFEHVLGLGEHLRNALTTALKDVQGVKEIRGQGLMLGIELDRPCGELVNTALAQGLLINVTVDNVIRLLPPLVLAESEGLARRFNTVYDRLYQQNHCGIYRRDGDGAWVRIGRSMPKKVGDIGFPLVVHPRDDNTAWVFPMDGTTVWPRTSPGSRHDAWTSTSHDNDAGTSSMSRRDLTDDQSWS